MRQNCPLLENQCTNSSPAICWSSDNEYFSGGAVGSEYRPCLLLAGLFRTWVQLYLAEGPITGSCGREARQRLSRQDQTLTSLGGVSQPEWIRADSEGHMGRKKEQALPRQAHSPKGDAVT